MPKATLVGALQTERLVGRMQEKAAIKEAIEAEGELRVLHIVGSGGIGKTRLLEEVPNILAECENRGSCRYGGIFDFYLTKLQNSSGLEEAIIAALDPDKKGFQAYRATRWKFEKLRAAGGDPRGVEGLRAQLEPLFVHGFNEISTKTRIILCFDTAELLQSESDIVQELCDLGYYDLEIKFWLLNHVSQLQNAVAIFASRPQPRLSLDLQRYFGDRLRTYSLSPFTEEETNDYFDAWGEVAKVNLSSLDRDTRLVVHHYTGGLPLLLSLVIEVMSSPLPWIKEFNTPLAKVVGLPKEKLEAIRSELEKRIIEAIMNYSGHVTVTLPYVAWARKGINRELLQRLTGWSHQKCMLALRELRRFVFVKTRPGTNWLFLHDEMYDLMDRHVLNQLRMIPDLSMASQVISQYYTEKMEVAKGTDWQDLAVERLYYQLVENPKDGYAQYACLSDEAVIGHEVDFDMCLRDEMLRAFNYYQKDGRWGGLSRPLIDRDAAVRWVKRYIAMGKYEKAIEVAGRIKQSLLVDSTDVFFTAALTTYQGEAIAYLGQDLPGALSILQQATSQLEMALPRDEYETWNQHLVLGRGYNDLGYTYVRLKQYDNAAQANLKALPHLRRTGLLPQQAGTLANLAYVYALQGRFDEATVLCRDALALWQRSGYRFGEGLTLNVLGLISIEQGIYNAARKYCGGALRLFKQLGDERGEGLACIALGQALRKEGVQDIYSLRKAEGFFNQGVERLERAIHIFTELVPERFRVVEAYSELGCTYREWAVVLRRAKVALERIQEKEDWALKHLDRSIEWALPDMLPEAADSLNDKAGVSYHRGDLKEAERCLDEADALVPTEYRIREQKGVPEIPTAVSAFWEIMGRNSLLRGHIGFARGEEDPDRERRGEWFKKAIEQYVLASVYFGEYSSEAQELSESFKEVYERLRVRSVDRLTELQGYAAEVESRYGLRPTRVQDIFITALGIRAGLPE